VNIPQFTAQASLYRTSHHYRSPGQRGKPQRTVIIPQLGGPGFEGYWNCVSDCVDLHPDWPAGRCRVACRDPGGTSPGPRVGYGPSCEDSPPTSCYAYLVMCALSPWDCAVADELVATCLENSRRECLIARHGSLMGGSSYPRSGVIRDWRFLPS